jgi:hypothetical protein
MSACTSSTGTTRPAHALFADREEAEWSGVSLDMVFGVLLTMSTALWLGAHLPSLGACFLSLVAMMFGLAGLLSFIDAVRRIRDRDFDSVQAQWERFSAAFGLLVVCPILWAIYLAAQR